MNKHQKVLGCALQQEEGMWYACTCEPLLISSSFLCAVLDGVDVRGHPLLKPQHVQLRQTDSRESPSVGYETYKARI